MPYSSSTPSPKASLSAGAETAAQKEYQLWLKQHLPLALGGSPAAHMLDALRAGRGSLSAPSFRAGSSGPRR